VQELTRAAQPRRGGGNAAGGGVSSVARALRWPEVTCGRHCSILEEGGSPVDQF
jgi:hypothetical protein